MRTKAVVHAKSQLEQARAVFGALMELAGGARVWQEFPGRIAAAFSGGGALGAYEAGTLCAFEGARRDVEEAGGKALIVPTDMADPKRVEAAASAIEDAFGRIANRRLVHCTAELNFTIEKARGV